jgi:hypothetical protein
MKTPQELLDETEEISRMAEAVARRLRADDLTGAADRGDALENRVSRLNRMLYHATHSE